MDLYKHAIITMSKDLINNHVIYLTKLAEKDVEDFSDNPVEFIRRAKDYTEKFYSSNHSAIEFILLFMYAKSKIDNNYEHVKLFIEDIVSFLSKSDDLRMKDALLNIIQNLCKFIKGNVDEFKQLEPVLSEYVLPNLNSENGIERYRAIKIYEVYEYFPFENEHLLKAAELIFNCLEDNETAVRIAAAIALFKLVKKSSLKQAFQPMIGKLFDKYISMMSEIDCEDLVTALEQIVTTFADSIGPYAIQLWENLDTSYWRLIASEDDEYGDLGMAALSCVSTVGKIFDAVRTQPDLLIALEK